MKLHMSDVRDVPRRVVECRSTYRSGVHFAGWCVCARPRWHSHEHVCSCGEQWADHEADE